MTEYFDKCLVKYLELSGLTKLPAAQTPFLEESKLPDDDFVQGGQLAHDAASILMSFMWLARMARWDLLRQIGGLASCITRWSLANDKQLFRLACYISTSRDYKLTLQVGDPSSSWKLDVWTDSDIATLLVH